jgi:hypothetical protein
MMSGLVQQVVARNLAATAAHDLLCDIYVLTMKDPEIEDKLLPRRKATTKKRGADA